MDGRASPSQLTALLNVGVLWAASFLPVALVTLLLALNHGGRYEVLVLASTLILVHITFFDYFVMEGAGLARPVRWGIVAAHILAAVALFGVLASNAWEIVLQVAYSLVAAGLIGIMALVVAIMVCFAALSPVILYQWTRARALTAELRAGGYEWIKPTQAWKLYFKAGPRAFRIPRYVEAAVLPGYRDGDIDFLARLALLRGKGEGKEFH